MFPVERDGINWFSPISVLALSKIQDSGMRVPLRSQRGLSARLQLNYLERNYVELWRIGSLYKVLLNNWYTILCNLKFDRLGSRITLMLIPLIRRSGMLPFDLWKVIQIFQHFVLICYGLMCSIKAGFV